MSGGLSPFMVSETYRIFTGSYPPPIFIASLESLGGALLPVKNGTNKFKDKQKTYSKINKHSV